MSLLAPAGLLALLLLPVIVIIHLWRVRYRRYVLSSTLLWSRVLSETPLRRPRRLPTHWLLLALQLAVLAAGALALSRPSWVAAGAHRHLVVAVDTSLAMSATDVPGSRLARAKAAVGSLIDGLGPGDTMTLVDAGTAPRVLASSDDRATLRHALGALAQGYGPSSLGDDGPLLSGLIRASGPAAAAYLFAPLGTPRAVVDALMPSRQYSVASSQKGRNHCLRTTGNCLLLMGTTTDDRGVAGLTVSCRAASGATACEAYARLVNTAPRAVTARITAVVDGARLNDQVVLPANSAAPIGLALPPGARTVELRLDGHDALPADDAAWAAVPLPTHRTVLLVTTASTTPGDPGAPLIQALQAIPNLTLNITTPDAYTDDMTRRVDLTVLDNTSSGIAPPGNLLVINPAGSVAATSGATLFTLGGTTTGPSVASVQPDDPLLHGVDLSSLVVSSATRAPLPAWAHADVVGDGGPLLFSGVTGGRRVAVLLFDPRTTASGNASNLDTLLAFPTLLQNAVQALAPPAPLSLPAGQVAAVPVARQGAAWLAPVQPGAARGVQTLAPPSSGDLAALPALRPGLYSLGAAAGGTQPIAANPAVPGDPNAPQSPATTPAPFATPLTAPAFVTPWEGWAILALLALLLLSGEWWYYVRRT